MYTHVPTGRTSVIPFRFSMVSTYGSPHRQKASYAGCHISCFFKRIPNACTREEMLSGTIPTHCSSSPLHSVLINKRFHQLPPSSPSFFLSSSLLFQLIKIISYPAIYDKFLLVKNRKTPAALRRRGLLRLSTSIFRYNYILFPAVLSSISLRSISVGLSPYKFSD